MKKIDKSIGASKTLGKYNQNIINRIDNMDIDSEYNPYSAVKKQTMTVDELFDNKEYLDDDEAQEEAQVKEKSNKNGSILPIIITVVLLVVMAAGVFILWKLVM